MGELNRSRGLKSRAGRVVLPYLILLLGFCFTLLVYHYFSKLSHEQDRIRFERSVQEIQAQVNLRIQTSITLLRAGTGLFAASDQVDAGEFARFIQQIELQKNYSGVQGIGFTLRFTAEEKADVIARMQREGVAGFHLWPEDPPRHEYTAILYLEPVDDRNRRAIGYDMSAETVRRQAMEAAQNTGFPTASGKVTLVQEFAGQTQQVGFLIYAPVYRKRVPLTTVNERREALIGFVYSPYRIDDFLAPVTTADNHDVTFKVYDGTEIDSKNLISPGTNEAAPDPEFCRHATAGCCRPAVDAGLRNEAVV